MRRTTAAAVLGLGLVAFAVLPVAAGAAEPTTTTTAPVVTLTTAPTSTTTSTTTTSTSGPATTTSRAAPTTTRGPAAKAHAASTATVTVATGGANCSSFCFSPAQTTIAAGGTVTFSNPTSAAHTVKRCTPAACNGAAGGTGNDPQFTSMTLALTPKGTFSYIFTQPGTYVFYCSLHGYALMHGTITVTAAEPTTTAAPPPTAGPTPATTPTTTDPNALASTGGSPDPLIAVAGVLLVVGLAAIGLTARRRGDHSP